MTLAEKLLNVRRATRLLASYNRRVITVVRRLDGEATSTAALRLVFRQWRPSYHKPLGKVTTSPVDRWGWDFVPLTDAWFSWTTDNKDEPVGSPSVFVGLRVQTDSGYAHDEDEEPVPGTFDDAANSTTSLYAWVFALHSGNCSDSWSRIRTVLVESGADQWSGVVQDVPTAALDGADLAAGLRYVGWQLQMETLETEEDVEREILAKLRSHLTNIIIP